MVAQLATNTLRAGYYLRPCGGDELVECRFLEAAQDLAAGGVGLPGPPRGDGAPAETGARKPGSRGSGLLCELDEGVQLGGRDLEVVAHGGVRGVHQAPELPIALRAQRLYRFEHPDVLRDDVPGALELLAREALEVFLAGVPQLLDAQRPGG